MAQGLDRLIDDQTGLVKDALSLKFLIPNIIAVLMIIGSASALIVIDVNKAKSGDEEKTADKDSIISWSVFGVGILAIFVIGGILAYRNKEAFAELFFAISI